MQISIKHGVTFLANPKCGTTTIERALRGQCEIQLSGTKIGKHINAHSYELSWKPFLKSQFPRKNFIVVCTTREPISRLISWYKYRSRDSIHDKPNYLGNVNFKEWCLEYTLKPSDSFYYSSKTDKYMVDLAIPISQFKNLDIYCQKTFSSAAFKHFNKLEKLHPDSYASSVSHARLIEEASEVISNLPNDNPFIKSMIRYKIREEFFENYPFETIKKSASAFAEILKT